MIVVHVVLCGHCASARPIDTRGAEDLPPGLYDAKLQVSTGICIPCGTKFSHGISRKGGVTQADASEGDNRDRGEG